MPKIALQAAPDISIETRPNARARRLTLRRSARGGGFVLTHPKSVRRGELEKFVATQTDWIIAHHQPEKLLDFGQKLPVFGDECTLVEGHKRGVHRDGAQLYVKAGNPSRAVAAYLKTQAALYAPERLDHYASLIGATVQELRWRDPKSRWGSCDSRGRIMLSWRLAMAPRWIFDYVIAHEVAHLRHLDHSPQYWRTLEKIFPETKSAKQWLREHGKSLQSVYFAK